MVQILFVCEVYVNWLLLMIAGGPGQLPHLAPTYAAVLSLCSLGKDSAYKIIDRCGF